MEREYLILMLMFLVLLPSTTITGDEPISGGLSVGEYYNLTISSSGIAEISGKAKVWVDGVLVGEVADGVSVTVEVTEGSHSIRIENQTVGSNYIYVFDHWTGGITDNPIDVSISSDTQIVAYFTSTPSNVLDLWIKVVDSILPGIQVDVYIENKGSIDLDVKIEWKVVDGSSDYGSITVLIPAGETYCMETHPSISSGSYNYSATAKIGGAIVASSYDVFDVTISSEGMGTTTTTPPPATPPTTPQEIVVAPARSPIPLVMFFVLIVAMFLLVVKGITL